MKFTNNIKNLGYSVFEKLIVFPYLPGKTILAADTLMSALVFGATSLLCSSLTGVPVVLYPFLAKLALCTFVHFVFFLVFRTYSGIMRYSTFRDALRIFGAVFAANLTLAALNILMDTFWSKSVFASAGFFINFSFTFGCIFFMRMSVKILFDFIKVSTDGQNKNVPLLVYGVNSANVDLVKLINHSDSLPYRATGFISVENGTTNKTIAGLPIYGKESIDAETVRRYCRAILINPAEMKDDEKRELAAMCLTAEIDLFSTPSWDEWKNNGKKLKPLKKVTPEELLERMQISIDFESIGKNLEGKTVLITGAAGSIGSEIVRQVSRFKLGRLLLVDIAESPLHQISLELKDGYENINFVPILCNVQSYEHIRHVFETYRPHYVYHAAAYKHVPLMEEHPCEAVTTNVLGSKNVADLSVDFGAEAFVMISTDKAVNPSNIMGATKRIAEIYVQALSGKTRAQTQNPIRMITTRFGNVLGSNGSVIPRFEQQIEEGGPITVTHPEMIRYFMTIPEACRLVLDAGNFGRGGEVFVFDMGKSVNIKDMAEKMIRLSGYEPYVDIDIVYTGLRPGEKLYEELLYDKETVQPTHNPKIMIGAVRKYDYDTVSAEIELLISTAYSLNKLNVVKIMKKLVPEFISINSIYTKLDAEENPNS